MAERVCILGAGSFGSVVARVVAAAVKAHPETFVQEIAWWVRRPELANEINEQHTNSYYLGPEAKLAESLRASTDMQAVVRDATVCILGLPGEFVPDALEVLNKELSPNALVVSLIKSLKVEEGQAVAYSEVLGRALGGRPVAAVMGPNIYREMAKDQFAEATVGCPEESLWPLLRELFETSLFHVELVSDLVGVELCGCLKNTVTISCGIADGLGLGGNVRAAIIRRGLLEIGQFLLEFHGVEPEVLFLSCGVGDLVLSCTVGRGRAVASAWVESNGKKTWQELEKEMLGGQRLPDLHNIENVYKLLSPLPGALERYPLVVQTYRIAFEDSEPQSILEALRAPPIDLMKKQRVDDFEHAPVAG